ncbi:MAG: serine/threonine protein kinase [Thermoproteaceae archaeon]|nr:serine/threonine protein kinase [Thermoproteaceae archaeon]
MDNAGILRALLLTLGGGLSHAVSVFRQLSDLQLELIIGGSVIVNGVPVVGKGTNSVVFKCRPAVGNFVLACKLRRGDASRQTLAREAQLLKLANSVGVGPELYAYGRDVVACRYVDGAFIDEWWASAAAERKRALVEELLSQAFRLDAAGISHNELSRLERHVLVERDRPVIVDFESATLGGGSNVTQVASGLARLGLKLPVPALREYKRCKCDEAFRKVLLSFLNQL